MDATVVELKPQQAPDPVPVPCAARPGTRFMHDDGPCRCFFGGPAPLFPPTRGLRPAA